MNNVHSEVDGMWKQFSALARGRAFERAEAVADRHALTILRQQIRDCSGSLQAARRDIAVATLRSREDDKRIGDLTARIEDLETRAIAALDRDRSDLAHEAADAIAALETERAQAREAAALVQAEVERLTRFAADAERRLRDLRNGQRLAEAGQSVARLRASTSGEALSTLNDAEATLARLRERQIEGEAVDEILGQMNRAGDPATVAAKLAQAGCGDPLPHGADAVLRRLSERRATRSA